MRSSDDYVSGGSADSFEIGAHVTIFARKQEQLDQAKKEVISARTSESQIIEAITADMSNPVTVRITLFL